MTKPGEEARKAAQKCANVRGIDRWAEIIQSAIDHAQEAASRCDDCGVLQSNHRLQEQAHKFVPQHSAGCLYPATDCICDSQSQPRPVAMTAAQFWDDYFKLPPTIRESEAMETKSAFCRFADAFAADRLAVQSAQTERLRTVLLETLEHDWTEYRQTEWYGADGPQIDRLAIGFFKERIQAALNPSVNAPPGGKPTSREP